MTSIEEEARALVGLLSEIRGEMEAEQFRLDHYCFDVDQRVSASNVIDYLVLRRRDLRSLQARLAALGLSSLGRSEPDVRGSIDRLLVVLRTLSGERSAECSAGIRPLWDEHAERLAARTDALFGTSTELRTRIMVTLPTEAADDASLVETYCMAGADAVRINCAHDDAIHWKAMARNVRRADAKLGRRTTIYMDLGGPKLRTGPMASGWSVIKVRPERDVIGRVVAPARVRLVDEASHAAEFNAGVMVVPVRDMTVASIPVGATLRLRDSRDSDRRLEVVANDGVSIDVETRRTTYFTPGLPVFRGDQLIATIGEIPPLAEPLVVRRGDSIMLVAQDIPSKSGPVHYVGCTLPAVVEALEVGHRVWFDDGAIGGIVTQTEDHAALIEVFHAGSNGSKLRGDKGINAPDTPLDLPALTAKDLADLDVAVEIADVVGLSFVSRPGDVRELQAALRSRGAADLGIVLKIETARAFAALPEIVIAALAGAKAGVMIARGDLAVECGWERLAEVQEEILWLCEAAHLPVIWATQVLETMAKTGSPSRSEVSDAVMAERAECVMLNKGPHIAEAIASLARIFERMEQHQDKKRALLRALRTWQLPEEAERETVGR